MQLDRVATERVLESIKNAVPNQWPEKVAELRALARDRPGITLSEFLTESGLELDDVYKSNHSWSELREDAGLPSAGEGPQEKSMRRAVGRLLHVDDSERLTTWRDWVRGDAPPYVGYPERSDGSSEPDEGSVLRQRRLLRMLLVQMIDGPAADMTLAAGAVTCRR
jgi:hypothetical protein